MNELEQKLRTMVNEKETKLLPENLKKGVTLLGVTGTLEEGSGEVINTSDKPVCHIFYSDEDAKAFTGYNPGDRALVYGLGEEPFSLNIDSFAPDMGINTTTFSNNNYNVLTVYKTVKLSSLMEFDDGVEWTHKQGSKTTACKFWMTLTNTSCDITMSGFITSLTNEMHTYKFSSDDGLTYSFVGMYDGNGKLLSTTDTDIARYIDEFRDNVSAKWDSINIISKFVCVANSRILKKIYMYETEPVTYNGSFYDVSLTDTIYFTDLMRSTITNKYTSLVAGNKPLLIQDLRDLFDAVGFEEGMVLYTDTDIVYICNEHLIILCDKDDKKYAGTYSIRDASTMTIYKYNLVSKEYEQIQPIGDVYTISDTNFIMKCLELEGVRYMAYYVYTKDSETSEVKHMVHYTDIWFADLSLTNFVETQKRVANVGKTLSLREDYLGLHGSAENVEFGSTAFINEYVEGTLKVGNISGDEEEQINAVLDEIIGGVSDV